MLFRERYPAETCPDMAAISEALKNPLWDEINDYLKEFGLTPSIQYSCCSMARGWNVKYKKSGRAICTLYPEEVPMVCLISIGVKEMTETEYMMQSNSTTSYVQELFAATASFNGSKWLMLQIDNPLVLKDVKELLLIRFKAAGGKKTKLPPSSFQAKDNIVY